MNVARDTYSAPPPDAPRPIGERAAQILVAWLVLLLGDNVLLTVTARAEFTGPWEPIALLVVGTPIAAASLVPAAFVAAMAHWHAEAGRYSPFSRRVVVAASACLGFALGWGLGGGRHLADPTVRTLFSLSVGCFVATGARAAFWTPVRRLLREHLVPCGLAVGAIAYAADRFVLPRLYEAFHVALAALLLVAASTLSRRVSAPKWTLPALVFGLVFSGIFAAFELARVGEHARLVALERSPLLGRSLGAFARTFPTLAERPSVVAPAADAKLPAGEVARALDWHDRTILVVTIDALRADHLPFHGYPRATAPNLTALAERGVVFENALTATPHTSYSVGSLWTGTYLRPLVALGLEGDPTTLPALMKLYGFETAAFYPPAVFYVDGARFSELEATGFGFNYRKVEFTDGARRVEQLRAFYEEISAPGPRFLWVHLFEPHEPYEPHAEHEFGPLPVDRYDGEIAAADETLGALVRFVRARDPRAVVVVSADHGEAFGEHGSTHHGTTVHDEQVHVPLVIEGEGILPGRVSTVVQTIDLAPTIAGALGMPRPARFRGRDLGPLITRAAAADDEGLAWSETEERTLVARGPFRLICARRERACALFDHRDDALELRDRGDSLGSTKQELRELGRKIEAAHGSFEAGAARLWPVALRRVAQGDREALDDALPLVGDVKSELRAAVADACGRMKDARCTEPLALALARELDPEAKAAMALALAELGGLEAGPLGAALNGSKLSASGRADGALARLGDPAAGARLVARAHAFAAGSEQAAEHERREVLDTLGRARPEGWEAALEANLGDVRLRASIVPALAKTGLWRIPKRIAALLADEREPRLRMVELAALEAFGATREYEAGLRLVAGLPEPPGEALERALGSGFVREGALGCATSFEKNGRVVGRVIGTMKRGPWRILVKGTAEAGAVPTLELDGEQRVPMTATPDRPGFFYATPPALGQARLMLKPGPGFRVEALWLVPATDDPALAARPKTQALDAARSEPCTEGPSCAKATPPREEPTEPTSNPHRLRAEPTRKRGAEGAAAAKKAKDQHGKSSPEKHPRRSTATPHVPGAPPPRP